MKVLFLDMDGAGANSDKLIYGWIDEKIKSGISPSEARKLYRKEFADGLEAIFPEKSKFVKKIIKSTGVKIVWSTDWRKYEPYSDDIESAKEMLNRHDMCGDALIGYTPNFGDYCYRCEEINAYIDKEENSGNIIEKSAVLDDRDDAGYYLRDNCKFFKTNCNIGITEEIADEIIKYFNE
jgi:hypothetical protein